MRETVVFTNMCMVYDDRGRVLAENRVDPQWGGITFPGGHLEAGEDFADAVIREVREETGLTIQSPRLCGIKHWYEDDGIHHVVLCYKTGLFGGVLHPSEEGDVFWVPLDRLPTLKLAPGMNFMLQLFLREDVSEHCFHRAGSQWVDVLK